MRLIAEGSPALVPQMGHQAAPALRRACALRLHWEDSGDHHRDLSGVACILTELSSVDEAKDIILALLLLDGRTDLHLAGIACTAALREAS